MHLEINHDLNSILEEEWDALNSSNFPFTRYAFLSALERSGAVSKQRGWMAHHLLIRDQGELVAALPSYLKSHSYGEYVFDFQWAEAYEKAGFAYYPKLISAIPFSPVTGPRLLLKQDYDKNKIFAFISHEVKKLLSEQHYSSWHILFPEQHESECFTQQKLALRKAVHFKWHNHNYLTFEDFLERCNSRHRKNIRKERKAIFEEHIQFEIIEGAEISEAHWRAFYEFYQVTYLKRSGHRGYLNDHFFNLLKKNMANQLVLIVASKQDNLIGAALYFKDSNHLYGRYWGGIGSDDFLHFEACYYQGIEYCIRHNLEIFDPGVQGEHKLQRGFEPYFSYSNHWVEQKDFRQAIGHFLKEESPYIDDYFLYALTRLPFKQNNSS